MGRQRAGATIRDRLITVRLNTDESVELERKRKHRGLDVSTYFRTLMKEDPDVQG